MLRFHGSRDKQTFELVGDELAARRDPGRGAARLPAAPRRAGTRRGARRPRATPSSGSATSSSCRVDEPGHVYHMYVVRTPERERIAAALEEAGIASASYYVTPLHLQPAMRVPRLRAGLAARDRAGRGREPRAADVGRDRRRRAGAGRRDGARRPSGVRRLRTGRSAAQPASTGTRSGRSPSTRRSSPSPGGSPGGSASTRAARSTTTATSTGRSSSLVVAIKLPVFALCGLLQPLVALRLDARHVGARSAGVVLASRRRLPRLHALRGPPRRACRAASGSSTCSLCLAFVAGSRLLARTLIERPLPGQIVARGKEAIVVGAGDAAQLVVKEMLRNPALGYTPIGLVDDDPRKRNLRLHGVRVLGTTADLAHVIRDRRPDEVLIAIPSASGELRARIVETARAADVPVKTLPSLSELVSGDSDLARQLRPVEVEDVLGREPVEVDLASIAGYLSGEVVLVTGRRRLDRLGALPADRAASARRSSSCSTTPSRRSSRSSASSCASAASSRRPPSSATSRTRVKLRQVFDKYRPGVVFHAAAYKHVAMMEANPLEAVRNNTLGTRVRRRRRRRVRREAIRARLDRQGREPEDRDGPVEGALRVDRRDVGPPGRRRRRGSSPSASATCSARRAR